MPSAPRPTPPRDRRTLLLTVLLVLLVAAVRLCYLGADPPADMPEANPMDEGLWADAARGQHLFGDWFADDTGNAWLISPLHSLLLAGVYQVFGIGLWQTRLVPALCGLGLSLLLGHFVGRRLGRRAGLLTLLLLGACPLLDQHCRTGLLESEQLWWIALAFVAIADAPPSLPRAALAGIALACAGATKPNALTVGAVPIGLVLLDSWWSAARASIDGCHRRHLGVLAMIGLTGLLTLLPFVLLVWLPHHAAWHEALFAESGADEWRLRDHLLRLGLAFGRETEPGVQRLWSLLRNAPAVALGFWAWSLGRGGRPWQPGERALTIWALATLLIAEADYLHVGRRQLLTLPAFAALAASQLQAERVAVIAEPRRWRRLGWWLLLALPLALLVRPAAVNRLNAWLAGGPSTSYLLGLALPLAAVAAAAAAAAAGLLPDPAPWRARVLRIAPLLVALVLAFDATRLAWCNHPTRTIAAAQARLRQHLEPGAVVLGQHASLLCLELPVRTVRRTLLREFFATPRANPDAFERLRPRYLLDYRDPAVREFGDLPTAAYQDRLDLDYLPEPDGAARYQLVLRERP